jgi:hypothetical protein
MHNATKQSGKKCGYINFRNVYWVPGKNRPAAFKNLGWQNNAWMQPNLQAGNTYTTDGTFYRCGSTVQTSRFLDNNVNSQLFEK